MARDARPCVNCGRTIVKDRADDPFIHEDTELERCHPDRDDFAAVDLNDGIAHEGHRAHFTGAWFCDTCNSPYCDLL